MRVIQIQSGSTMFDQARKRLEAMFFNNSDEAVEVIRRTFPNHVVVRRAGTIEVTNRDATFKVLCFKEHLTDPTRPV